jgi:hypothetical protein
MYYDIPAHPWNPSQSEGNLLADWHWDCGGSLSNKIMKLVADECAREISEALKNNSCFELSLGKDDSEAIISFCSSELGDNFGFSVTGSEIAQGLSEALRMYEDEGVDVAISAYKKMALAILDVCKKHKK